MTASVRREVDGNLLRGAALGSAQDAGGQDLSDLVEALRRGHQVGVKSVRHGAGCRTLRSCNGSLNISDHQVESI
jgi:hypothetical protein